MRALPSRDYALRKPFLTGGPLRASGRDRWAGRRLGAGLLLTAFLALSCGRLREWRAPQIPEGGNPVQMTRLENGLTLLTKEDHSNPIVTVDVWVNTGSINEPPALAGVSHFLEHMMFKGTKKRPVGQVDLDIETVGGETNAGTAKDFTHYYITVAGEYIATGLDVLSDVMMNSVIDPLEMEQERQVILEEFRRKQDSPFNLLYDEIHEAAFTSGPYRRSVIGTFEAISKLTRAQMVDYYQRYYTPDNMVLVIVGDFQTAQLIPQVRKYFGRLKRTLRPYENVASNNRRAAKSSRIIEKDVRDTYTILGFPAPGIARPHDTVVMDVLTTILGEGRSSRLYQTLREREKLVTGVSVYYGTPKKPGLFLVFATLDINNLDAMSQATLAEIERLRNRRVGARELNKAKKIRINDYYFQNETTNGQSEVLGLYYVLTGSEKFEQSYLREVQRVTAADVQRVAREYLDPAKLVSVTATPKPNGAAPAGVSEP
jgi:zinc protease